MTWSYSGDPSSSDLNKYRFILGDTDSTSPIMQDEEIQYLIDTYGANENNLMHQLFIRAATLLARDIKRSLGPQAEDPSGRLNFYKEQATLYSKKLTSAGLSLPIYAHDKIFKVGMHSNPPYESEV